MTERVNGHKNPISVSRALHAGTVCLLPTDLLTLLPEPPVPLRHKDRGPLFNLTDGQRAYKGKAVRTHSGQHTSCAGGKWRPCPGCGLFFHRNCLTPPGKAFPELKLGKQRKMHKPLEPSQQMSYKAIGPNTVLRPDQARPGQSWSLSRPLQEASVRPGHWISTQRCPRH